MTDVTTLTHPISYNCDGAWPLLTARRLMAYLHVQELLESLAKHSDKRRFVYFIASPDETGQSWCPDCRRAQPFVDEARTQLPENAIWKDPQNEFRVCPKLAVKKVPTILEFETERRLEENQITVSSILDMFKPTAPN
ncbi:Thioredoxin domain-containing protein 17 [Sparganum proliferum]